MWRWKKSDVSVAQDLFIASPGYLIALPAAYIGVRQFRKAQREEEIRGIVQEVKRQVTPNHNSEDTLAERLEALTQDVVGLAIDLRAHIIDHRRPH